MNDEDKRANRRVPVALRIRLRYQQVDQFISKFAVNVSRGGMFLSSRNPKPVGTRLQFEMRLADDSPVIEGAGEVRWIREYDKARPNEPYGMGIRFTQLNPESRALIERIIEHRRSLGGGDDEDDDAIPMSPFVGPDGERQTASTSMVIPVQVTPKRLETMIPVVEAPEEAAPEPIPSTMSMSISEPVSTGVPVPLAAKASGALPPVPRKGKTMPPPIPGSALAAAAIPTPNPSPSPSPTPTPIPIPDPTPIPEPSTITSPSPITSPITSTITSSSTIPEPEPEPELAPPERMPIASPRAVPPIVDSRRRSAKTTSDLVGYLGNEAPAVRAAVERARALAGKLAGSEIDHQLAMLLGGPEEATPEVTIDAASRELAERLGGAAVARRELSGRNRQPEPEPAPPGDDATGTAEPIDPDDILDEAADG